MKMEVKLWSKKLKLLEIVLLVVALRVGSSLSQANFDCGVSQVIVNELIIHGNNTIAGVWPWHVAIYHKYGEKPGYVCGGTLVTKTHVVTAAHCANKNDFKQEGALVNNIFVRLGVHQLNSMSREVQLRMIREIYSADNFSTLNLRNDIVILELTTEAEFGKYVQPACISLTNDLTGQLGTVVGWGIDESNRISAVLKSAQVPVVDFNTCLASSRSAFGKKLDEGTFCAGYTNGTTICNGDSGGGIFFEENGAWYLGGIVSFSQLRNDGSTLCSVTGYAGFTRIYTYLAWIRTVTKLGLDGLRYESKDIDTIVNHGNRLPRNCGTNTIQGGVRRYDPDVLEFPWTAILHYKMNKGNYSCVGSLIHKRYVLTAATCTTLYDSPYQVQFGGPNITRTEDSKRIYGIHYFLRHPKSSIIDERKHNIALICLNRDVEFSDHIRPICLPVSGQPSQAQFYVTTVETTVERLIYFHAPAAAKKCPQNQKHIHDIPDNALYIESKDNSSCQADRGGVLGYTDQRNGEHFVQLGVLSVVLECNSYMFTNVTEYLDWILSTIIP